ncbi:MAG: hypothetical protein ACI8P3_002550 [Saprospiraceae bacterium]|jgi:hypothetical protein
MNYKRLNTLVGWIVFAVAMTVYYFSAERTGSLWDCGEFITGAYKLQVVHPPGAPLFIIVGRMFVYLAELFTDTEAHPENIAFAVNLMSGVCTAFAAMFICWATTILGKLALLGRDTAPDQSESIAILGAGLVAGLTTAFCTSVWFSAVEGEVYAMSTFFTALTFWAMMKWYNLPNTPDADRWIIFAVYAAGLSTGVHLLSLLTFPALAMFYYFKKKPSTASTMMSAGFTIAFILLYLLFGKIEHAGMSAFFRLALFVGTGFLAFRFKPAFTNTKAGKEVTILGTICSAIIGVGCIVLIQELIIIGIPSLWKSLEFFMANSVGTGFHSGIYPLVLMIAAILGSGFYFAHTNKSATLQKIVVAAFLLVASYSTIGIVVIRANANTPINMNAPSDPMRLLPYLNREQYGERPLVYGPHYMTSVTKVNSEERYGQVITSDEKERYEIIDEKNSYEFDKSTNMLFPRMGHNDEARKQLYEQWMNKKGPPNQIDNVKFFLRYQVKWMYWRYFMWNFSGRQNGEQGFYDWDPKSGNWLTGFDFIDNARLYNQNDLPDSIKNHEGRNKYYMLPFLFGLIGLLFHYFSRPKDMIGLLALFIITGLGIIVYSNQPPNEPRERDYVLVGSFLIYSIWVGMGVLGLFKVGRKFTGNIAAPISVLLVLIAPLLMGTQNFDDHSRKDHTGSRDYASDFLNSCAPNAIIFTYGDNDTYPLWYAQETEGIRTDVRVVNLSLISVDWYIDQLRRKVNDSPAIDMTITREAYRGRKRLQIPINPRNNTNELNLLSAMKYIGEDHPLPLQSGKQLDSFLPANKLFIPVNEAQAMNSGAISIRDTADVVDKISFTIPKSKGQWLLKGDVAILDIVATNAFTRPIYFAVTCRSESMLGLEAYMQLEGLSLRFVPIKNSQDRQFGMVGYGRVNADAVYENIMTKFKWGGFDKHDTFINRSYGPSIQSIRAVIMRTSQEMVKSGDTKRATELIDKYFESFPEFNFPYDRNILFFARTYLAAGDAEKAKEVINKVAKETDQQLYFMNSLNDDDLLYGFASDANSFLSAKNEMVQLAKQMKDTALEEALMAQFSAHTLFEQRFRVLIQAEQKGDHSGPLRD